MNKHLLNPTSQDCPAAKDGTVSPWRVRIWRLKAEGIQSRYKCFKILVHTMHTTVATKTFGQHSTLPACHQLRVTLFQHPKVGCQGKVSFETICLRRHHGIAAGCRKHAAILRLGQLPNLSWISNMAAATLKSQLMFWHMFDIRTYSELVSLCQLLSK